MDFTPIDLDTGIVFRLDTSITNNPTIHKIIKMALHDWTCQTTVKWKAGADTTLQQLANDNVSLIYLDDSFHGKPLGKFGGVKPSLCIDLFSGDSVAFFQELDIASSRDLTKTGKTWLYDTTYTDSLPANKSDFYAVVLHELGHAHSITHVNDYNELMFHTAQAGPIAGDDRINLFGNSPSAVDAGLDVMDKSTIIDINSCVEATGMTSENLVTFNCGSDYIKELFQNFDNIISYPNPFYSNNFNVSYDWTNKVIKL